MDQAVSALSPLTKITTLEALAARRRACGGVAVLAHGTFDLLHVGHIRHLEAAAQGASLLFVTITSDRFVAKGPGRPVFSADLRAEALAALECVDGVAIIDAPTALPAIEAIRPDVYVKGADYRNPDRTGNFAAEKALVESYGGKMEFTDEIAFSSSNLINRHFNGFEPKVRDYLDKLRDSDALAKCLVLIDSVADMTVLMVGDTIIDEYQYVMPMHKTPKESMLATRYQGTERFAGGVIAAANHVAGFCKQVDVVTCYAAADDAFIRNSVKPNVGVGCHYRAPTTTKRRFVAPDYMRKLFEVYEIDDSPLPKDLQKTVNDDLAWEADRRDLVIVTDFGHGLIAPTTIGALIDNSRFLAVNTQSNSANLGFNPITKYGAAPDYICIDAPEARMAAIDRFSPIGDIARRLGRKVIVTQGKDGCVTWDRNAGVVAQIPAVARNIVDTVGAGDAFLAVTAPLVAAGGPLDLIGFIGNVVGALKVEIVGHRKSIEKAALVKAITGLLK